jgi:two-component system sensor histidine kinase QseC
VIFSAALQGYRTSTKIASSAYDDELKVIAQGLLPIALNWSSLKDQMNADKNNNVLLNLSNNAKFSADLNLSTEFAYQIIINNVLVAKSLNAPLSSIAGFESGFSDLNFAAKRWRTFSYEFGNNEWIVVAQQQTLRGIIVEKMILAAVQPIILVMPLLGLLIFFITTRSLTPLKQLSNDLQNRQSTNLSQLDIHNTSSELAPVIQTLNQLFFRLSAAFEREREFVSHAAHELRTPLSVMKINLHNLLNTPDDIKTDLPKLQDDVERMIQAVNQLLMLSKTNPEAVLLNQEKVDVLTTAQIVIADIYPQIEQKQQTIELLGEPQTVMSKPFLIQTLISNLISNASKYAPKGGHIRVHVKYNNNATMLTIEDSGPGIPISMRDNVVKRFYRTDEAINKGIIGSGLGLTIVAQILSTHGASLSLLDSELGGLLVEVKFTTKQSSLNKNED